jgi:hypothetical protein
VEHVAVGEETRPYPTHRIGIQNGTIPIAVLSWSWKFNVPLCSNGSCCSERRPISGFVSSSTRGVWLRSQVEQCVEI